MVVGRGVIFYYVVLFVVLKSNVQLRQANSSHPPFANSSLAGAGRTSEVERSLMVRWVVGSILHGVDPLSYFSFQPVLHKAVVCVILSVRWCI